MTTKPQTRSAQQKSPHRLAVERVLESSTGDKWMTNREIQFASGVDKRKVADITGAMLFKGTAESRKVNGKTQYRLATRKAEMTQPMNGPGHTMKPLGKLVAPTSSPLRNSTTSSKYDGAELGRNPGIPDDRFAAFDLPSLVNGIRVPPRRITAMCVGAVNGPVGGGQPRRIA